MVPDGLPALDVAAGREPPCRRLTPARRALAERYVPLARKVAGAYEKSYPQFAGEFFEDAYLALVDCAGRYVPRGKFATFAYRRLRGAMIDTLRRGMRRAGRSPQAEPGDFDAARAPGDAIAAVDDLDAVLALTASLRDDHRAVVLLRHVYDLSYAAIARRQGCCKTEARQRHARALRLLRDRILRAGEDADAVSA